MMRRLWIALAVLLLVGCRLGAPEESGSQNLATVNGPVEFTFPDSWFENDEEHPFDLQVLSRHQRMNTGVFLFAQEDLADDFTPRELFELQIEELRSKRTNFAVVEAERVLEQDGKRLTTIVYSGDKGSLKNYYKFTVIEFSENPELIPVVLQVSIPSYWDEHKPVLEEIVESAQIKSSN